MIKTDKGEYLSEFTSEMMAKVNRMNNQYLQEWEVCVQVTGKTIDKHEQDYVNANWDMPYPYGKMTNFLNSANWYGDNKEKLALKIKELVKGSVENTLKTNFGTKDFEFLDNWIHSKDIQDSLDNVFDVKTKQMHEKISQSEAVTFTQALEHMHQFKKGMFGLRNFISDKVMPIIKENVKILKKKSLKVKEQPEAKKQKQG